MTETVFDVPKATRNFIFEYGAEITNSKGFLGIFYTYNPARDLLFIWNVVDLSKVDNSEFRRMRGKVSDFERTAERDSVTSLHIGFISPTEVQPMYEFVVKQGMRIGGCLPEELTPQVQRTRSTTQIVASRPGRRDHMGIE